MCVSACTCMCVCKCVCVSVCVCACLCARMCVCVCVCMHTCTCMCVFTHTSNCNPVCKQACPCECHSAQKNLTSLQAEFALDSDTNPSEYLPFAGLVGAGNSNTCVNNAVGIQHLHHFTELFLQVSLKLFVTYWKCVE